LDRALEKHAGHPTELDFSIKMPFDVTKFPRPNRGYVAPESFKMKLTE
jgi:hypothetical protein